MKNIAKEVETQTSQLDAIVNTNGLDYNQGKYVINTPTLLDDFSKWENAILSDIDSEAIKLSVTTLGGNKSVDKAININFDKTKKISLWTFIYITIFPNIQT